MVEDPNDNEMDDEDELPVFISPEDLGELIEHLISYSSEDVLTEEKRGNKQVLKSVLGEFFDSYIIFGFHPNGEETVVQNVANPRDQRGLSALVEEYMTSGGKGF